MGKRTTFNDVRNGLTTEERWSRGPWYSEMGRSGFYITCPFCDTETFAYVWSLAASRKRCNNSECGALFNRHGTAYRIKD